MLPCSDFFFSLEIILFFCFKGKRNAFLGQYLISTVNLQKYEKNQMTSYLFSVCILIIFTNAENLILLF